MRGIATAFLTTRFTYEFLGKVLQVELVHSTDRSVTVVHSFPNMNHKAPGTCLRRWHSLFQHRYALAGYRGNAVWFSEFRPKHFLSLGFMFHLLQQLYRLDIYCHVSWSFLSYLAGIHISFEEATLFNL